jgi:hypothetical protein
MEVETYEVSETAAEPTEASEEAIGLIDELGLVGQRTLVQDEDDVVTRVPYRCATAEEVRVFRALCPIETKLVDYAEEPIPLRVLQVAAHARGLNLGDELLVWHRESSTIKDPVLVAREGDAWSSDRKYYLLARWGEELESWPTLVKLATEVLRQKFLAALAEIKTRVLAAEASIDARALGQLGDMPQAYHF